MTAPVPSPVEPAPVDTPPAPAPVPTPPPAPPAPPVEPPAPVEDPAGDTPEIAKVRKEAATYRTRLREQEAAATTAQQERDAHAAKLTEMQAMIDAITKAVTGKEDEPADPAKLAEQLEAEKAAAAAEREKLTADHAAQIRALTVQATLPAVLAKAGANPDLTTAVLTANGSIAKLDPSAPTFAADLESAVTAALDAHPALKTAPVAVRSGAEIPGRSGGSDQLTLEQVKAMKPAQIEEARVAGRLKNLGFS